MAAAMEPTETRGAPDSLVARDEALRRLLEEIPDCPSAEAFWQTIKRNIRERLGQERYSIWFKQTALMGVRDERLVVGVPHVIVQQYLTERYVGAVEAAVRDLIGESMPVAFDVAPQLFRRMRAQRRAEVEEHFGQAAPGRPAPEPMGGGGDAPHGWGFENLIVTDSNRFPVAAARELGGQESPRFRFLYICGDYGLGKSALLRGAYALACGPERGLRPLYVSAEDWCNDYYHAIQRKTTRAFRHRFRSCDMLLMDDVQFVEGKPGAQRELLHTVKQILAKGGRVGLAGKPYPEEFRDAEPAFLALMQKAFTTALVRPRQQERVAVVAQLAARRGLDVGEDVCALVAQSSGRCFAAMETAVAGLALFAGLHGAERLTLSMAFSALAAMKPAERRPIGLDQIRDAVQQVFNVTAEELRGRSRMRTTCRARHVAMYLSRKLTGASLAEIGRYYGKFSHSTVKHAACKIELQAQRDEPLAGLIARLESALGLPGAERIQ